MDIDKLNIELQKINEFRKADAGEEIPFIDSNDAINKLKSLYDAGEINAICSDAITLKLDNNTQYKVSVVLGNVTINKNNTIRYERGMNHSLKYHANKTVNGKTVTENDLIGAMKNTEAAFNYANKHGNVKIDNKSKKIIFSYNSYTYIICLARNEDEINYLHNVFKHDSKRYKNNVKRRIK